MKNLHFYGHTSFMTKHQRFVSFTAVPDGKTMKVGVAVLSRNETSGSKSKGRKISTGRAEQNPQFVFTPKRRLKTAEQFNQFCKNFLSSGSFEKHIEWDDTLEQKIQERQQKRAEIQREFFAAKGR